MLIGSTLLAIGAPSLGTMATRFTLDGGTRAVAMALSQARVSAITRGHPVSASFTTHGYTMTDTVLNANQIVVKGNVPAQVLISSTGTTTFTPLGTISTPLVVTLRRGDVTRFVRVGLTGEVQVQ